MVPNTILVLIVVISALGLVADEKSVKQTFLLVASSISNDSNTTIFPTLENERWILNKSGSIVIYRMILVANQRG